MACGSPVKYAGVPDYEAELKAMVPLLYSKDHRSTAFRFLAQHVTNIFTSLLPVKANFFDPNDKTTWPLWNKVPGTFPEDMKDGDLVNVIKYYMMRGIPDTIPGAVFEKRTKENLIWNAILTITEISDLDIELDMSVNDDLSFSDPSIYPLNIGIGMDAYLNQVKFVIVDKITKEVLFKYSAMQDCLRIPLTVYDPDQAPVLLDGRTTEPTKEELDALVPDRQRPQPSDYSYVIGTSEAAPYSPGCSGHYHVSYVLNPTIKSVDVDGKATYSVKNGDTVDFAVEHKTCHYDFVLPHMIMVQLMIIGEPYFLLTFNSARIFKHIKHTYEITSEGRIVTFKRRDGPVEYIRCRGCDPSAKRQDYSAPCGCGVRGEYTERPDYHEEHRPPRYGREEERRKTGTRIPSGGCGGR